MLLLSNEKLLLLVIKKSLLRTFGNIASTYKIQNKNLDLILKQCDERNITEIDSDDEIKLKPTCSQKFKENLIQWKTTGTTDGPYKPTKCIKRKQQDEITQFNKKVKKIQNILSQGIPSPSNLKSLQKYQNSLSQNEKFTKYSSESDSESDYENKNHQNSISIGRNNSNFESLQSESKGKLKM